MPPPFERDLRQRVIAAPSLGLCLDFANTRFWRGTEAPTESLVDYDALVRWLAQASVVGPETVLSLGRLRDVDLGAAQRLFADALQAREMLYRLFSALVTGSTLGVEVRQLNALLAASPPRKELVLGGGNSGWRVPMITPSSGELLAPILWSAADLSLAVDRVRLRICDNGKCRWLFLDESKGGTRRWCSMSSCGNRAKVHRHFLRKAKRVEGPSES